LSPPRVIKARGLVEGTASGPALVAQEPVSFLGDVAITTGEIVGELPSVRGRTLGGHVLVFPGSMGSAGAWRFVYQLYKHDTHPVALVARVLPDPSVVQGAILAGITVVYEADEDVLQTIENGDVVEVDGKAGTIRVRGRN
jgi:predicted aconitase with swiveling domain